MWLVCLNVYVYIHVQFTGEHQPSLVLKVCGNLTWKQCRCVVETVIIKGQVRCILAQIVHKQYCNVPLHNYAVKVNLTFVF